MIQKIKQKDIKTLIFAEYNPRQLTKDQYKHLKDSIERFGFVDPVIVNKNKDRKNIIIGGHQRVKVATDMNISEVPCVEIDLTYERERELNIRLNRNTGEWDMDSLANFFDMEELIDWGFDEGELVFEDEEPIAGLVDDDEIPEVEEAVTKLGDLWLLGEHRLLCGDSTKKENVDVLMDGNKAELVHADPPYGMGKENDGVLNDNLYNEKLDKFQMEWWKVFRTYIDDNGSAYIWGNAEDLWRLWYKGGLKDSERLTFRNEIIWNKGDGLGMNSEKHRQYPTVSERCLFFMFGEQGFNNNADNYWEGWDSVVNYLKEEKEKSGLTIKDFKRIAGHSEKSGCHWFDKSQWMMPTEETYKSWQNYCKNDAFKKDYDDLKKDFYKTRAFFNNTHDNMADIWDFARVQGEDRHGHATPKPIAIMERIIKSSSKTLVIEPFLGSGSTLIACEKTNRKCYGMELDPHYCDVIVKRWENFTGKKATLDGYKEEISRQTQEA